MTEFINKPNLVRVDELCDAEIIGVIRCTERSDALADNIYFIIDIVTTAHTASLKLLSNDALFLTKKLEDDGYKVPKLAYPNVRAVINQAGDLDKFRKTVVSTKGAYRKNGKKAVVITLELSPTLDPILGSDKVNRVLISPLVMAEYQRQGIVSKKAKNGMSIAAEYTEKLSKLSSNEITLIPVLTFDDHDNNLADPEIIRRAQKSLAMLNAVKPSAPSPAVPVPR